MNAERKPRFRIVANRPVEIIDPARRESPLESAKRIYGKPWAFERGSKFEWKSGPSVLNRWLFEQKSKAQK